MSSTHVHTSKKLEKLVKKVISIPEKSEQGILGKWNATIFYIERKNVG